MLGGINTALFLTGLGGFFILIFVFIPLLKWIFPTSPSVKAHKAVLKELRRDVRRLKRK